MATNSGIAIKGDKQSIVEEYEKIFDFSKLMRENVFDNLDKFNDELFGNYLQRVHKGIITRGVQMSDDWTMIVDPEIVDWVEKEKLEQISKNLNTEVFTYLIQTTSNSFAFAFYDKSLKREFISIDGQIQSDFGNPLIEENNLEISEQIFIQDIEELTNRLGINLVLKTGKNEFIVKEWADNNFQEPYPTQERNTNKKEKKPWWKIG